MAKENCGCHITWDRETYYGISYCSVHAAAFEMREALKTVEAQLLERDGRAPSYIRAALSLASGKEADHGKPIDP